MMPLLLAHGGAHSLAAEAAWHWTWEPVTATLLLLSAILYAAGLRALWQRAGVGRGIARWQAWSFTLGLLSLAVALFSPVAWLSESLLSVHMTQHEILMLFSAPLLVFGHPLIVFLWAAPARWRDRWGGWIRRPRIAGTWRTLTAPLVVFLAHGVAIWVWHVPVLYEAALRNQGVHALEHFSFVVTAALFWWGMIHGRYGRIGYGLAVLYVFITAVHTSILGALMTIAPDVWYASYTIRAAAWHVNALEDQQLAGLLMWVPSGLVFIVLGLALFAAWLGESERRATLGQVPVAIARGGDGVA